MKFPLVNDHSLLHEKVQIVQVKSGPLVIQYLCDTNVIYACAHLNFVKMACNSFEVNGANIH